MSTAGRSVDDITQGSETQNVGSMDTDEVTTSCTSKGKKLKSTVWQNMSRDVLDDGTIKATCNFCKKLFTANSTGGEEGDDDYDDYNAFLSKKMKVGNKSELELYLEEKNASINKDLDILSCWRENATRYPSLALLARDLLCIPISTVPSESTFSLGKKLITPYRSSLSSTTIEAIACYEDWLRAKGFASGPSKFFNYGIEALMEAERQGEEPDEVESV